MKNNSKEVESMEKIEMRSFCTLLLQKVPNLGKASCSYRGTGDSFEEFDEQCLYDTKGDEIEWHGSDISKALEDLIWAIIQYDGRGYFDNDGSRGEIVIDFLKGTVNVQVYDYQLIENDAGDNQYDDLLVPLKKKPVEFSSFVKKTKVKKTK
jgi:hypothetical protein